MSLEAGTEAGLVCERLEAGKSRRRLVACPGERRWAVTRRVEKAHVGGSTNKTPWSVSVCAKGEVGPRMTQVSACVSQKERAQSGNIS